MAEEATETVETQDTAPEESVATETTEEPQAPDVGEALQQMGQRLDEFGQRLPEPEQDDTDLYSALTGFEPEEEEGEGKPEGEDDDTAELRQMMSEAVQEQIQPYILQQEAEKREGGIRSLADEHPRLKEPEVIDAVAERLEAMGLQPANGFPPDPRHVETVYKAYEAEAAASTEASAEAGGEKGATLETGAGPGAPQEEVDPVTQAYLNAIKGSDKPNAFTQ